MLLVVIASCRHVASCSPIVSCRHVASCSPIASCRLSRRVASYPFTRLLVGRAVIIASRRCRLASPVLLLPSLALLHRCLVVIAHRPTAFGWLLCLFPLSLAVAVSCIASRRLPSRIAPLPPCLNCWIVASHRAHLSRRCSRFVDLPRLFVGRAIVVVLRRPHLASPVLLCRRSCVRTHSISIAMAHQCRDAKSIRRRVGTPGSYRHQSLPPAPARWRKRDNNASTPTPSCD
jgi:hypothetical protein